MQKFRNLQILVMLIFYYLGNDTPSLNTVAGILTKFCHFCQSSFIINLSASHLPNRLIESICVYAAHFLRGRMERGSVCCPLHGGGRKLLFARSHFTKWGGGREALYTGLIPSCPKQLQLAQAHTPGDPTQSSTGLVGSQLPEPLEPASNIHMGRKETKAVINPSTPK